MASIKVKNKQLVNHEVKTGNELKGKKQKNIKQHSTTKEQPNVDKFEDSSTKEVKLQVKESKEQQPTKVEKQSETEQLPDITPEVVEKAEEYSPLLKEFENVDVKELFKTNPKIEEKAKDYLEKKGETEFFETLSNNPGALAGFVFGLQMIANRMDQINEENRESLKEFEGLDIEGLQEENPKIEKIAEEYRTGMKEEVKTFSDYGREILEKGTKAVIKSNIGGSAIAGLLSAKGAVQALKNGNYKLATAYSVGLAGVALNYFSETLIKNATLSVNPGSKPAFDANKIEKQLKKY